jgi:hypothetical protein
MKRKISTYVSSAIVAIKSVVDGNAALSSTDMYGHSPLMLYA